MTLKERARKLKQDVPAVFLALKGRDTPLLAKILAGVTVAYALAVLLYFIGIIILESSSNL